MAPTPNKDLTILHICSWYPNRVVRNDGNFIAKQIKTLSAFGHHTVIGVYEDPHLRSASYEICSEIDGSIHHILVYYRKSIFRIFKPLKKLYYYYIAYRYYLKNFGKPGLIHAHITLYASVFARAVNAIQKIPYVITEHSSFYLLPGLPFFLKWILNACTRKANFILPVSKHLQAGMERNGIKGNYRVIANVVDCHIFRPATPNAKNSRFQFLHISGFTPEKNISDIFKAIKILGERRDDFVLRIAGDGDISVVEQLATRLNINPKHIELTGELSETEVAYMMQTCDVFVIYSQFETFSVVAAEALAAGKPVIFSDIEAQGLFEESGGMIIVKRDDPVSLANTMEKLINHPHPVDPDASHQFIVDRFSSEIISSQLISVYRETLDIR